MTSLISAISLPASGQHFLFRRGVPQIKQMTQANPLWGAPRIHGELLKLGIDISERSVSRLRNFEPPTRAMLRVREKIISRRVPGNITFGFASLHYVKAIVL